MTKPTTVPLVPVMAARCVPSARMAVRVVSGVSLSTRATVCNGPPGHTQSDAQHGASDGDAAGRQPAGLVLIGAGSRARGDEEAQQARGADQANHQREST
ncbi:hypothetical protein GCM10010269_15850 [Streptomyces humidus]|uniref:Uncharacterized protein n=1 Tax=Streptomyces humidus TaxID=52259 RepID=A0A918FTA4_9ACTN|nr:hypothetical protein GCM10010269_15850 [Streptomyces humidus]